MPREGELIRWWQGGPTAYCAHINGTLLLHSASQSVSQHFRNVTSLNLSPLSIVLKATQPFLLDFPKLVREVFKFISNSTLQLHGPGINSDHFKPL